VGGAARVDREHTGPRPARLHARIFQHGLGQMGKCPFTAAEVGRRGPVEVETQGGRTAPVAGLERDLVLGEMGHGGGKEPTEEQARAPSARAFPFDQAREQPVAHVERPGEAVDLARGQGERLAVEFDGASENLRQRDHGEQGPSRDDLNLLGRRGIDVGENAAEVALAVALHSFVFLLLVGTGAHVSV